MKRSFCIVAIICSLASTSARAEDPVDSTMLGTLFNKTMFMHNSKDSLVKERHRKTFFHQLGNVFTRFFREFNSTDSSYIEDQHYNYTVMLQNTNTYEEYTLRNSEGQSISFAPDRLLTARGLIWAGDGCS